MNQLQPGTALNCFHCGQRVDAPDALASGGHTFCSAACRDAASNIQALDLADYYDYRERFSTDAAASSCCEKRQSVPAGDDERRLEYQQVDRDLANGLRQVSLHVPDIRCAACTWLIESSLAKRDDVKRCSTILADRVVSIDYDGEDPLELITFIESLGFTPLPDLSADVREAQARERKQMTMRLGVAGIGMMQVMMYAIATYVAGDGGIEPAYLSLMHWASLAMTAPIVLYSAMPFHRGALRDLAHRSPGMDVPVSLAICSAFALSLYNTVIGDGHVYYDSVAMFTFLLLLGRFVEMRSRQKYENSRLLAETLLPAAARIEGEERPIAVSQVVPGMRLTVGAGERVTADGIVLSGESTADEAAFSGESIPIEKAPGSRVLAGSLNLDGPLVVESTAAYGDFVINRISAMYRDAASWRPRFSNTADSVARYFVMAILGLAVLSGTYWYLAGADGFTVALTVLVVSCPCALSLATPVAYTVALSSLRQAGVVISNGSFLERLSGVSRIVFDKTGTLTRGRLVIDRIMPGSARIEEHRACAIAAGLERGSQHPIAAAFEHFQAAAATDISAVPGKGVEGTVDGVCYRLGQPAFAAPGATPSRPAEAKEAVPAGGMQVVLADDDGPLMWFILRDEVRPESAGVVADLKRRFQVSLFTGDPSGEALSLGSSLDIDDVRQAMSPADKIDAVRERQAAGEVVLMVGDGINDAGAMSTADASLAVSPADIMVQEAADATLLNSSLQSVPALFAYASRVRRIIRQNVFWAIGYNLSVIPLAVTGVITPWMAAIGMSASSLLVVLNANRLGNVYEWK